MDTKSKKFDRTWVTKTLAFLLAVVLTAYAAVNTVGTLWNLHETTEGISIYLEDVLRGFGGDDLTKTTAFANETRTVESLAVQRYLFGDGSETAYATYLENRENAQATYVANYSRTVLQNCLGNSGHGSPVALQKYLRDGMITLEKLADHKKHFVQGEIYVADGTYFYEDADGNGEEFDTGWMETSEDAIPTTTFLDTETQAYQNTDYNFQSSFAIPQSVTKQLKDGEAAVELCHTTLESSRHEAQVLDGYYALKVNERVIASRYDANRTNYTQSFDSYDAFHTAYELARKEANQYKYMQFAVVDNRTGRMVSNVAALDGKTLTKGDLQRFTKAKWNFSIDLLSGARTFSKAAQKDADSSSYLRGTLTYFLTEGELNGTLYVSFDESLAAEDAFRTHQTTYEGVYDTVGRTVKLDLICLAGILLCLVYLVIRAGRRHDDDELHMLPLDRIFTLLRLALHIGAIVGLAALVFWYVDQLDSGWTVATSLINTFIGLCAAAAMAIFIDGLLFVVRHIKEHTLFRNLFLVWLIRKIRTWHKAYRDAHPKKEKLPVEYADLYKDAKKRVLLFGFLPNAVLGILVVIFMASEAWFLAVPLLFVIFGYDVWLAVYVLRYAYRVRAGIEAVHRIRGGDYDVHLAVDEQSPAIAGFARDVNSINDGLRIAVSNAIKDEHMRTELITNVSHDLKTPLTSIINYVDLLSRCDIQDETAKEYLAVLGEKSERLKKLIEDLVEASKASSGNIRVDLVDLRLAELANQIAGEYEDAFRERNLELITSADSDVVVRADSKLCYRVLDNLMNNVKKYAMPGTRVYLSLTQEDAYGVLTLLNVSQTQLNIPVEELMERFVRGDASRSTDGSGLGLSIAQNLCELQGAKLELSISGDLFTAKVKFQKA